MQLGRLAVADIVFTSLFRAHTQSVRSIILTLNACIHKCFNVLFIWNVFAYVQKAVHVILYYAVACLVIILKNKCCSDFELFLVSQLQFVGLVQVGNYILAHNFVPFV
jgi:hypothetical protein